MKYFFTFLFSLLFVLTMYTQKWQGKVTDKNLMAIEGVYIYNKTSGTHSHTNETGRFTIPNTKVGDSVLVGGLGYQNQLLLLSSTNFSNTAHLILTEKAFQLEEVVIKSKVNALNGIVAIDLKTNPVKSSQEILRKVPGLFIGQHAGGGKAEQLFLRGFDIDHGTDVAIEVDGLPVNMVSHAHGQGYSDLHFLIPETIENINFGKGPYNAGVGNFGTAGYVGFQTKERLDKNIINLGVGQFNTLRTLGMFKLLPDTNKYHNAYIAMEYLASDGFFETSQNFSRINLLGKYTGYVNEKDKLSFIISNFSSSWDASGQIPQRAVNSGLISRFGAIDDTEGGYTSRFNISANYTKILNENTFIKNTIFYSAYDFELYSNFTFFLNNPDEGDQIRQKEARNIYGFKSELNHLKMLAEKPLNIKAAIGLRFDDITDNELSETVNRKTILNNIQLGDIKETNVFSYLEARWKLNKFTVVPSLRLDHFRFNYTDKIAAEYQNFSNTKTQISPKLSFLYNSSPNLQWFVKSGLGFHSNDARLITKSPSGETIPNAIGIDVGTIWKPAERLIINTTLWYLALEDELVYVGDEGIVEPTGETRRLGIEGGLRLQLSDYLFIDTDATYAYARSIENPAGEDYIPLAPVFTWAGGISLNSYKGFNGSLRARFLGDRPANEDNSIVADGYFIIDFNLNYSWKNYEIGVTIENLFDNQWNETQFATLSRLQDEPEAVEEIHFTPGTPFALKVNLSYRF